MQLVAPDTQEDVGMKPINKPICAICNRAVEEFLADQCDATMSTTFIARCHGAEESVTIPYHELHRSNIKSTVAFQKLPEKLPSGS